MNLKSPTAAKKPRRARHTKQRERDRRAHLQERGKAERANVRLLGVVADPDLPWELPKRVFTQLSPPSRSFPLATLAAGRAAIPRDARRKERVMAKKQIDRSSVSGRFVTHDYAKKHPRTTETEKVTVKPPKRSK